MARDQELRRPIFLGHVLEWRSWLRLVVVDELQDFDEAKRGPQSSERRVLVGIDRHRRLPRRLIVQSDSEVQVDPAALPLDLVDLAFAVVLAGTARRHHDRGEELTGTWVLG
jgi:hypothetical protein